MSSRLLPLFLLLLGGVCSAADRGAITAERQRLEATFAAEEAQCRERFAVTACVDDVRQRRRAALARPRAQELALDDVERQQKALARREAVARKQKEAAERPVVALEPQRAVRLPAPAAPAPLIERRTHGASEADEAARRAAVSRERRDKIAASQDRIVTRQVERASRHKKPSEPLPVPAAASASRR